MKYLLDGIKLICFLRWSGYHCIDYYVQVGDGSYTDTARCGSRTCCEPLQRDTIPLAEVQRWNTLMERNADKGYLAKVPGSDVARISQRTASTQTEAHAPD